MRRPQLKRDLAGDTLALTEVLADPRSCAHAARVGELLSATPGVGPALAGRALARCRIAGETPLPPHGRRCADLIEVFRR